MKIEEFKLERLLSVYQNQVDYELSDTGVESMHLHELVSRDELDEIYESVHLRYIQTNGVPPLREAICDLYPGTDIDHVLVTNGSSEANFATLWRLIEPGDEVVVILPNYMQVPGMVRNLGAKVKSCYLKEEISWAPDLAELERQVTSKTKLIYFSNPNNPTGAVMDETHMEAVVRTAERVGAWILSDEVYRGAELDGDLSPTFWDRYDRTLVVGGLSKAFALPGLRTGWVVGPKELVAEIWGYTDYTTITTGAISARLATLALRPETRVKILERNRRIATRNLAGLTDWLAKHADILRFVPPRIGGVTFIGYNLEINSTELVMKLLHEQSVLIVPGDHCGLDGYLRIGYGSKKLPGGLERISKTLEELKASNR
jgi:aspartate/methionine/tyrosine aminotransferase